MVSWNAAPLGLLFVLKEDVLTLVCF
jgi:hypothetical protein